MEANATLATGHSQGKTPRSREEALTRAISGQSLSNFPAIYLGFAAKGIPEADIKPRENVFMEGARALCSERWAWRQGGYVH